MPATTSPDLPRWDLTTIYPDVDPEAYAASVQRLVSLVGELESLFQNRLDRGALDTMLDACRRRLPDFQRYLRAKARALGIEKLAWYDLWAPMPGNSGAWPWETCTTFVIDQFDDYSAELGALARRALNEHRVDARPRADKTGGGWRLPLNDGTSRVLLNHIDTFDDVICLAHELGHAYHNRCDVRVSPWRRESRPTILAETASTFCKTLVTRAAVTQSSEADRLPLLDASLQAANMSVTEMAIAVDFESAVIDMRAKRELSADEFTSLLHDFRHAAYGDAIDANVLSQHNREGPPHYYMPWKSCYNYPYTFGLLFGLGLYATCQREPDTFRGQFDGLLASTGDADVATLTRRFGIDIQASSFWDSSLDAIGADIDTFVELVDRGAAAMPASSRYDRGARGCGQDRVAGATHAGVRHFNKDKFNGDRGRVHSTEVGLDDNISRSRIHRVCGIDGDPGHEHRPPRTVDRQSRSAGGNQRNRGGFHF